MAPSRRWARLIAGTFEHGHRAVFGGVLVGGLLDVLDLEAVVEVVQSWAGINGVGSVGDGVAPVNKGTRGSDRGRGVGRL